MPSAKPFLHPLKTPKSATFPSELHDEILSSTSDAVKPELSSSTPITPPTAYTDFLKAYTPVFTSPASAGVTFPRFPLDNKSSNNSNSNSNSRTALIIMIIIITTTTATTLILDVQLGSDRVVCYNKSESRVKLVARKTGNRF